MLRSLCKCSGVTQKPMIHQVPNHESTHLTLPDIDHKIKIICSNCLATVDKVNKRL